MSILIKNMEMPKYCRQCFFFASGCPCNKYKKGRPSNCPLIEDSSVVSREDYEGLELVCKNYEEALKDAVDELEKKEVEERKKGEWDMFDLISSAYYGKGMYFKQDNGTVYSRHSGEYMTFDEAIREFVSLIDEDAICVPSVTTMWADGEAPTYVLQKKGKWINPRPDSEMCSACGTRFYISALFAVGGNTEPNYCPNCGARMDGEL